MVVVAVLAFAVVAVIAGAEAGARHAGLEALAVVLLAARLPTVAALEVMLLLLSAAIWYGFAVSNVVRWHSRHGLGGHRRLQVEDLSSLLLIARLLHDLALPESVRISHQDLLFGLQSHLVELCRVVAADAGAGRATVSVIGEAFAIELEAAALTTVAGLIGHE